MKRLAVYPVLLSSLLCSSFLNTDIHGAGGKNNRIVRASGGLRMRNAPGLHGKKLFLIPNGNSVRLLEERGSVKKISGARGRWSRVEWRGKTGWVFGGFLSAEPFIDKNLFRSIPGSWIMLSKKDNRFIILSYCNAGTPTMELGYDKKRRPVITVSEGQSAFIYYIYGIKSAGRKSLKFMVADTGGFHDNYKYDKKTRQLNFYFKDRRKGIARWDKDLYLDKRNINKYEKFIQKGDGSYVKEMKKCGPEDI